jgi:hypothetical protein
MFAGAVEGGLMGGDLESPVRQSSRLDLVLRVDQNIVYLPALFADKMLVGLDQRVEMLRAPQHQDLELFVRDQFLQVPINRSEAHIRQTLAYFIVNLIRRRMRAVVLDRFPNNFQLFGVSWFRIYFGHNYVVRSSIKDCRVPGSMGALAL